MFAITQTIWQGPFESPKRLPDLRSAGITHILNVGEAPNLLRVEDGPFVEIAWCPVDDLERIPDEVAQTCINTLHRMACCDGSKIYIHCIAGWNRSPTVLWLYLVACGLESSAAKELICGRNLDAIPGHSHLVDVELVKLIQEHGKGFQPHPRPIVLEAA